MKHLKSIFEKKEEKSDKLEDCPSFKEFNQKIDELKKITKKIHSELKRGTKGEIDDYIEKKIFGRDVQLSNNFFNLISLSITAFLLEP